MAGNSPFLPFVSDRRRAAVARYAGLTSREQRLFRLCRLSYHPAMGQLLCERALPTTSKTTEELDEQA
jgi:hypothetical protein